MWPTPACLSTRATSSPPVRSAIGLSVSLGRTAIADHDERRPEERVRRLGSGPERVLRTPQRFRLADAAIARLRREQAGGESPGRTGGARPVRHREGPRPGVEDRAREPREALAAERAVG